MDIPARKNRVIHQPGPRLSGWIVLAMFAMFAFPAGVALHTVRTPAIFQVQSTDPTPHGYTWSLLLFVIPIAVIGGWFLPLEQVEIPQKAFWRTIAILVPLGFGLDFFFAERFLCFTNPGATIGIPAPALGKWVPIEEYIFYFTGFVAVLLIYIWLDEYWLNAYNVKNYPEEAKRVERLLKFHFSSLLVAMVLIAAAIAYKKWISHSPDGFPGYFTFLVVTALVPAAAFFPEARRFINWRALSLTLFIIVLVSLFWEATLAVPYGWWGYQPREMMGLSIGAWRGLPVEAVCVWIAVTYATVIVYEVVKIWNASGKPARQAFLGESPTGRSLSSQGPRESVNANDLQSGK
jgi:hypothetical protein